MTRSKEKFSKVTYAASAVLLVGVLVMGLVLVLSGGNDSSEPTDPDSPAAATRPPAEDQTPSMCNLDDGDWNAAANPPLEGVRWVIRHNLAAPVHPELGPGEVMGLSFCFARNPLGAVSAAMWFLSDAENPEIQNHVLETFRVSESTRGQAKDRVGAGDIDGELVGFAFLDDPTADRVDVELLLASTDISVIGQEALVAMRITMVWERGDWRVEFPAGSFEYRRPSDRSGFTEWGPRIGADDDGPAALGRPAPAFTASSSAGERAWESEEGACGQTVDASGWNGGVEPALNQREKCWVEWRAADTDNEAFAAAGHAGRRDIIRSTDAPLNRRDIDYLDSLEEVGTAEGFYRTFWPQYYELTRGERNDVMDRSLISDTPYQPVEDESGEAATEGGSQCGRADLPCMIASLQQTMVSAVADQVGNAVSQAVESGANSLAEQLYGAFDALLKSFMTSWLNVEPLVAMDAPEMQWLTDNLRIFTLFLSVIGLMIAGLYTMWTQRGDRAVQAGQALIRVFLVSTLGVAAFNILLPLLDAFSHWIVDSAGVATDSTEGLIAYTIVATNPGLALVAGIFGILATGFQWGIMLIRAAILPLLVAVWPLAAAAAMVKGGEQTFATLTKWLLAFLLIKPAAAIIYAFAWRMRSSDDIVTTINGVALVVLGAFALPALLRLIAPQASALGSAAGGSMAMGMVAAGGTAAVAAGAAVVTGGGSLAASAGGTVAQQAGKGAAPTGSNAMTGGSGGGGTSPGQGPTGGQGGSPPSPAGPEGASGAAGSNATAPAAGSSSSPSTADGASAAGIQAGSQSLGGTVAQGAENNDGSNIIGGEQP